MLCSFFLDMCLNFSVETRIALPIYECVRQLTILIHNLVSNLSTMAFHHTNLPTHELVLGLIYTTFFLLLATNINSVQALSFNFTKFTPHAVSGITFQGDAQVVNNGAMALTKRLKLPSGTTRPSTGRVLSAPVSLWDTATGNVASFITSFSFVIEHTQWGQPTDGVMFFIAPQDTVIPPHSTSARFGVVDIENAYNQFVGVEFDLYTNHYDPKSMTYHIGINANSLISLKVVKWEWVSGSLTQVSIAYDSPSNTLSVVVTYANGKFSTIAQIVDLKAVLPNMVRFGLSGASITGVAHDIHSWSLSTSDLKTTTSSASDKLQDIYDN